MSDRINHPPHYKVGGFECLEVIEALELDFHLGQVIKYLWRAGRKLDGSLEASTLNDLCKAQFYLSRAIELRRGK